MRNPSQQEIETTERLFEAIIAALDEQAEIGQFTTGEAMNALFSVLVLSAQQSPQYDPKQFIKDVDGAIREAIGLQ